MFTNDWGGLQTLGRAAWLAAGLAVEGFAAAVAGGAYAAAGLYTISNHETMPMACSPRFAICTGNNIANQQYGSQAMASEAKENAELQEMVPPVVTNTASPNPQDPNEKPPQDPNKPATSPLKPAHKLKESTLDHIRKWSTEKITNSLKPGSNSPLTTKPDGTIMQGNHRVEVLRERGINVDNLPRETYTPSKLPELGVRKNQ